nr:MAG TPA: hypothetical protein [Caudoviricetes sp.]
MEALIIILLIIIIDIIFSKNTSSYYWMKIPKNKGITKDEYLKKGNNSSSKE